MNKIKIFTPVFLISCLAVFMSVARADFMDCIPSASKKCEVEVMVQWAGFVNGEPTFNILDAKGEPLASGVSGSIDKNGRGVPDLRGITVGPLANQIIEPPRIEPWTPLDSSPRHDQYFNEEVNPGNSLIGSTSAGQTYYTDKEAVNSLSSRAEISLQEAIVLASRLAGKEITWEDAGRLAGDQYDMKGKDRGLTVDLIKRIFADAGASVQVIDNGDGIVQRGELFNLTVPSSFGGGRGGDDENGGGGNGGGGSGGGTGGNGGGGDGSLNDPTCAFTASRLKILYNQPTTLEWRCSNADTCSIAGIGSTPVSVSASGERDVNPLKTTTYTLTCRHGDQSASSDITVQVFTMFLDETIPEE